VGPAKFALCNGHLRRGGDSSINKIINNSTTTINMGANNKQSKLKNKEILAAFKKGTPKDGETTNMAYY
jgi:hypothetical protein